MLRLVPRETHGPLAALLAPLLALAAALSLGAALFASLGVSPLAAYALMAKGALGSGYALSEVLVKAGPLLFTGLAVALAARLGLWNVGAEGQLVLGGVCSAGTALFLLPDAQPLVLVPACLAAGALGGALYALGPALLRARFAVSEILTTLLLNYVAVLFLENLYYGPWRDPAGFGFPGTAELPVAALLPRLPGTRLHLGIALALAAAPLLHLALSRTVLGYRVRVAGASPKAARYAGIDAGLLGVFVLCVSGALAGLAGTGEVLGIHHRLQEGLAVGQGFAGIIVAWLARVNLLAVPASALCLAALLVGGDQLQAGLGLPSSIALALEAAVLFGFLAGETLSRYRVARVKSSGDLS